MYNVLQINIPMLFINSKDDPIVPCEMFDIPRLHTGETFFYELFIVSRYTKSFFYIRHTLTVLRLIS